MDDLYRGQYVGKYEILTQLSIGGMAELFLAFTAGPGGFRKYVVVKRILPDVKADDQFVKMFLDEARITAALTHPNIGQVFDLGEEEEGLYLAMEFISGQNLNQVAGACSRAKRPIPVGFSLTVARDVCNALHYAHTFTDPTGRQFPVIHRDVAQKNVMVTYEGVTKLLDFGIAKAKGKLGRTNVGMVKGTTGYMSPEQVRGEELDGRSDVFSVGVMLHELLTGRRLFSAETELKEMELILKAPIPRVDTINPLLSEEVTEVVARALARERADRWQSAREMARAIERAAGGRMLFDAEQMSGFMKELFEDKMSATRALLESAGAPDSMLAKAAITHLRGDDGLNFVETSPRPSNSKAPANAPPREKLTPSGGDTPRDGVPRGAAPTRVEASPPPSGKEGRFVGTIFAIALAVCIVLAGYAVHRFVFSLPPASEDIVQPQQTELKPFVDPRLKPYPEPLPPGSPDPAAAGTNAATSTSGAAANAGGSNAGSGTQSTSAGKTGGAATRTGDGETNDDGDSSRTARKKRAAPEGTLTLITNPESTVLRGKKVIGQTPLFNASLPAGTHLLRLQGPDGTVHTLSAPIKAGENTKFRVKLADLPTE